MKLARGWRIALRILAIWWVIVGPLGLIWFYYHPEKFWFMGMGLFFVFFTVLGLVILTRLRISN